MSETMWGGSEEKGAEMGGGDVNDVRIEINRIKNVKFLNSVGFPLL